MTISDSPDATAMLDDLVRLFGAIGNGFTKLIQTGVSYDQLFDQLFSKIEVSWQDIPAEGREALRQLYDRAERAGAAVPPGFGQSGCDLGSKTRRVFDLHELQPVKPVEAAIRRLLAEATSPLPDQAPAIQAGVVLFGVPMMFEGALSETPEGGLRLLSPVVQPGQRPPRPGERVEMLEQFFGYEDVAVFAVRRQVNLDKTRIIQTS